MKICIYGAGAVGGLIGGVLAERSHTVCFIARGQQLKALKARGCTLETGDQMFTVHPDCSDSPSDFGMQDFVFIAVKAPALPAVAEKIAPLVGKNTVIIPAMNGIPWWFFNGFPESGPNVSLPMLDPGGLLSKAIPIQRLIGCVVHVAASVPEPGLIRHVADNRLILGEISGELSDRLQNIVDLFKNTALDVFATNQLRQEIWLKLLGNFNFAPISSLANATNAQIGEDPGLRKLALDMFEEAAAAGYRVGLQPGMTAKDRVDLGASMGNFRTSMLQDFDKARQPEIDAIVSAVIEIGQATGSPMPLSKAILSLLVQKARGQGLY